jgi:hypothetical protein
MAGRGDAGHAALHAIVRCNARPRRAKPGYLDARSESAREPGRIGHVQFVPIRAKRSNCSEPAREGLGGCGGVGLGGPPAWITVGVL